MGGLFIGYQIESIPISQERKSTCYTYSLEFSLSYAKLSEGENSIAHVQYHPNLSNKFNVLALILTQILTTYNPKDLIERVLIKS